VPLSIPRDEIVSSLGNGDSGGDKKSFVDVVDFSQLGATDEVSEIDTGVTSGADPSEWDPINIDEEGHVDSCKSDTSASQSGNGAAPAVCESADVQSKKPTN
jgi:hypothetical protein